MFKLKPQITRYHLCLQGRFNLTHSISMCYEHPCWSFVGSTPRKRPALVQSNDWSVCLFPYIQFSSIIRSKEWNSSCEKGHSCPINLHPLSVVSNKFSPSTDFLSPTTNPLDLDNSEEDVTSSPSLRCFAIKIAPGCEVREAVAWYRRD